MPAGIYKEHLEDRALIVLTHWSDEGKVTVSMVENASLFVIDSIDNVPSDFD